MLSCDDMNADSANPHFLQPLCPYKTNLRGLTRMPPHPSPFWKSGLHGASPCLSSDYWTAHLSHTWKHPEGRGWNEMRWAMSWNSDAQIKIPNQPQITNLKFKLTWSNWKCNCRVDKSRLSRLPFSEFSGKQVHRKASLPASPVVSASSLAQGQLTTAWSPCYQSLVFITYMHITLRCRALHTHSKPHGHDFDNKKDCPGLIQASTVFGAQVDCGAPHCMPWSTSWPLVVWIWRWNVRDMETWMTPWVLETNNLYSNSGESWKCNLANSEYHLLLLGCFCWGACAKSASGNMKSRKFWRHSGIPGGRTTKLPRHFIRDLGAWSTHLETPRMERMKWDEVSNVMKFTCTSQDSKPTTNHKSQIQAGMTMLEVKMQV